MTETNHFHLTLPSNASMNIYSQNTASQFTIKLPKRIELDGQWAVSLNEISAPLAFDNISTGLCKFELRNEEEHVELTLKGGMYEVNESVLDALSRMTEKYGVSFHLVGRRNRKVKLIVGDSHAFRPNSVLSHILGLTTVPRWYDTGEHIANTVMSLPPRQQISTLYVYCDILEHVIVGDVTAPLLRVVDVKINTKKLKMHTIMNTPLFVPVQKKAFEGFDTITVHIMTDTGDPAPFSSGKSHIVLELKKVGLLNSLI